MSDALSDQRAEVANFFGDGSPFLAHPLLTAERTRREVDFIVSALRLHSAERILDAGCGFGRHSIELAARGYNVVGIDPSATMIAAARQAAQEAAVAVDFRQIAGQQFAAQKPFGAAVCLFTTLGQVSGGGDNSAMLTNIHDALATGSPLMVEVPQREAALRQFKAQDRFGGEEQVTQIWRSYDEPSQVMSERFLLVSAGRTSEFLLQYRLYSYEELLSMLQTVGFAVRYAFGEYAARPLTLDDSTMLLLAVKEG